MHFEAKRELYKLSGQERVKKRMVERDRLKAEATKTNDQDKWANFKQTKRLVKQ